MASLDSLAFPCEIEALESGTSAPLPPSTIDLNTQLELAISLAKHSQITGHLSPFLEKWTKKLLKNSDMIPEQFINAFVFSKELLSANALLSVKKSGCSYESQKATCCCHSRWENLFPELLQFLAQIQETPRNYFAPELVAIVRSQIVEIAMLLLSAENLGTKKSIVHSHLRRMLGQQCKEKGLIAKILSTLVSADVSRDVLESILHQGNCSEEMIQGCASLGAVLLSEKGYQELGIKLLTEISKISPKVLFRFSECIGNAINSESAVVRRAFVDIVGNIAEQNRSESIVVVMFSRLKDSDGPVRCRALQRIEQCLSKDFPLSKQQLELIFHCTDDHLKTVRQAAMHTAAAICKIGHQPSLLASKIAPLAEVAWGPNSTPDFASSYTEAAIAIAQELPLSILASLSAIGKKNEQNFDEYIIKVAKAILFPDGLKQPMQMRKWMEFDVNQRSQRKNLCKLLTLLLSSEDIDWSYQFDRLAMHCQEAIFKCVQNGNQENELIIAACVLSRVARFKGQSSLQLQSSIPTILNLLSNGLGSEKAIKYLLQTIERSYCPQNTQAVSAIAAFLDENFLSYTKSMQSGQHILKLHYLAGVSNGPHELTLSAAATLQAKYVQFPNDTHLIDLLNFVQNACAEQHRRLRKELAEAFDSAQMKAKDNRITTNNEEQEESEIDYMKEVADDQAKQEFIRSSLNVSIEASWAKYLPLIVTVLKSTSMGVLARLSAMKTLQALAASSDHCAKKAIELVPLFKSDSDAIIRKQISRLISTVIKTLPNEININQFFESILQDSNTQVQTEAIGSIATMAEEGYIKQQEGAEMLCKYLSMDPSNAQVESITREYFKQYFSEDANRPLLLPLLSHLATTTSSNANCMNVLLSCYPSAPLSDVTFWLLSNLGNSERRRCCCDMLKSMQPSSDVLETLGCSARMRNQLKTLSLEYPEVLEAMQQYLSKFTEPNAKELLHSMKLETRHQKTDENDDENEDLRLNVDEYSKAIDKLRRNNVFTAYSSSEDKRRKK